MTCAAACAGPDGGTDSAGADDVGADLGKADGVTLGPIVQPADEACPLTALDRAYLDPPRGLTEDHGRSHARLIAPLRAAAQLRDAEQILVRAAAERVRSFRTGDPSDQVRALADLAVTGRAAYEDFRKLAPTHDSLRAAAKAAIADGSFGLTLPPVDVELDAAVDAVLNRAYLTAWALRGPTAYRVANRWKLGWIAVSGEDDAPHRPVNVPSAPFPQADLSFSVPSPSGPIPITVRYMVAAPQPGLDDGPVFEARTVPPETLPRIPDGDIALYLPGHGSRLEEALDLALPLQAEAHARGRALTVISLDMPSAGYSSRFDHTRVAPAAASQHNVAYPGLDFYEESIVAFVAELDRRQPGVANRFVAVMGGSLGGNMSLRLARRDPARFPWLHNVVAWSPASIWESWGPAEIFPQPGQYFDFVKHEAVRMTRDRMSENEGDGTRESFLDQVFGPPLAGAQPVAERWYREGWEPCRSLYIDGSTRMMDEVYGPEQRRFHWRIAHEQLIFSHRDPDPGASVPRYATVRAHLMLASGAADNNFPEFIFKNTREVGAAMGHVCKTLFIADTGHSIHDERPRWFAGQIAAFLY
jgi:hypothetical protein